MTEIQKIKNEVKNVLLKVAKKRKVSPLSVSNLEFWENTKIKEEDIRKLGGITSIKNEVLNDYISSQENTDCGEPLYKTKYKTKYVVTSAIAGAPINTLLLKSLLNYCKMNKAQLCVLPIYSGDSSFDKKIIQYMVTRELYLNKKIKLSNIRIPKQTRNPLSGLLKLEDITTIYASSKIALVSNPRPETDILPRLSLTTGTLSHPSYSNNKMGLISKKEHDYGAVIVEVENSQIAYVRHVYSNEKGIFFDLFKKYNGNKISKVEAEALIMGDIHVGSTCSSIIKKTKEICSKGVKNIFLHDLFDSYCISHHHEKDLITKVIKANKRKNCLEKELEEVASFLSFVKKEYKPKKNIYVVESNHDNALNRYIKEKRFMNDYLNFELASQLTLSYLKEQKPLPYYLQNMSKRKDYLKDIAFLDVSEDLRIEGVRCSTHGHLGVNGSKGSLSSLYGTPSIRAHSHSCAISRRVAQVGTSTKLKLEYNLGDSSWTNTHCLIYKGGFCQLITFVKGNYKI